MYIKRGKKNLLTTFYLIGCLLSTHSISAQFYTIKAKEAAKAEVVEQIIENSKPEEKEVANVKPVINPGLGQETINLLDGMRRRQYLSLPIDSIKVNSNFGYRNDPFTGKRKFHNGVDLDADFNYVYSIMPGKVVKSGKNKSLGEFIQIEHGEFRTTYGHLLQRLVDTKVVVEAGQAIGISGSTGRSTGEHLHFGMSYKGKAINPQPILDYILSVMLHARTELERIVKDELTNK